MGTVRTDKFRRDAVRIVLTSGLSWRQVAVDLGVGLSTLSKWVNAHRHTDVVSAEDCEFAPDPYPQGGEGHPKKPPRVAARLCAV